MARLLYLVVLTVCIIADPAAAQTASKPQAPKKPAASKAKPPVAAPAPAKPAPAPPPIPTDVKMVTAYSQGAQIFANVTYVRGARQRVEFPGVISIDQCDLQRTVLLNAPAKRFRIQPYATAAQPAAAPQPAAPVTPQQAAPKGGVVTITTTLTDTLERQTIFGLEARRIKTVMVKQADATACDKSAMRIETDAWYVNLPKNASGCTRAAVAAPEPPPAAGECRDRVEARVVGDVTMGFPVKTTTTTTTGEADKQETSTTSAEVTTLEVTSLDPQLFEVPADYAEASSSAELIPVIAGGGSLEDALFGSTADGTSQAAPKKAGVTRIGVLEPVNKSNRTLNTRTLRQSLTSKFNKSFEAIPLSGSSAADIEAEARRLECDYILLGEIAEVKTSKPGKVGGFLKMASGSASPSKEVHEVKANYKLFATNATSSPKASGDVKASSGGGFGLGSALRIASFAGQMYMGMGMMRGLGGFGGLGFGMNPMNAMASMGNLGPLAGNYFDPRATAISSMSMNMTGMFSGVGGGLPGMPDPSDGEVYQTASDAFENMAKAATAKLGAGK
jgi:hypothetical protein